MLKIILALMLVILPAQAHAVTQWSKTVLPATGDNLTAWPTAVNAQWSILDTLVSNYRKGQALVYSSASTLIVSAGEVVVSNSLGTLRIFLQNTSNSNVTFANIDTGPEASGTTYYVYCGTSSATASTCTYYVSLSSSAPSGVTYYKKLGSFYNNSSSDIDQNKIYTEPYGAAMSDGSGIPLVVNTLDYGTSTSSSTHRNGSIYYFAHGVTTDAAAVSNLPYTSSTSYSCSCIMQSAGAISQNVQMTAKSASSFTCSDGLGNGNSIDWTCFGY